MATTTDNIGLIKPTYNEDLDIDDINDNSDVIDTQIQALKDVITNAKALLGQLGVDSNGNPLINAASARSTLDAAQSESATGSLHDSELAISDIVASTGSVKKSNGSYVPLQSQISTLQDSVSRVSVNPGLVYQSGFSQRNTPAFRKLNGVVYFAMCIAYSNSLRAGTTNHAATLSEGCRPLMSSAYVYPVDSDCTFNVTVEPDGRILIAVVGADAPSEGWVWIRGSYLLA